MSQYPFEGPRFSIGEKVRLRTQSHSLLGDRISHLPEDYSLTIEDEWVNEVPVDPSGYPANLDFSHQMVKIEEWNLWYPARHFEAVP